MNFERESAVQAVAAGELAHDLGLVSATAASHWVSEFDSALADWIDAYGIATAPPFQRGRSLPGRDETPADLRLTRTLQTAQGPERVYAWARLWRVGDT